MTRLAGRWRSSRAWQRIGSRHVHAFLADGANCAWQTHETNGAETLGGRQGWPATATASPSCAATSAMEAHVAVAVAEREALRPSRHRHLNAASRRLRADRLRPPRGLGTTPFARATRRCLGMKHRPLAMKESWVRWLHPVTASTPSWWARRQPRYSAAKACGDQADLECGAALGPRRILSSASLPA